MSYEILLICGKSGKKFTFTVEYKNSFGWLLISFLCNTDVTVHILNSEDELDGLGFD